MVGILGLQSTYYKLEVGKAAQISEARIFQEERPTCESGADTPFKPLKSRSPLPCQGENASDLIIGMVRMPKGFWTRTGPGHGVECQFIFSRQRVKHTL